VSDSLDYDHGAGTAVQAAGGLAEVSVLFDCHDIAELLRIGREVQLKLGLLITARVLSGTGALYHAA
jgi:hypothetical protein